MASGGNEVIDKNAVGKKNFLRKFGRRMGNVFTRKRMMRGDTTLDDVSTPYQLSSSSGEASGVVTNPLMAADLPAASVYQSSRSHPISVSAEPRARGGGGGRVATRLSAEFTPVSAAMTKNSDVKLRHDSRRQKQCSMMSEESVSGSGPPPERCLSEGNLVESSPPQADQLGGLGGRIWRVVPSSMDSLPKALQSELNNKISSRAQSISEDEGLPHSPSDTLITEDKSSSRVRTVSQDGSARAERHLDSLGGQTALLSQSSRSLMSCDGVSDSEPASALDLDFNALRRAESLDNTAAKHKIQVSRPRKSRSSSNTVGGLRKHKSMSTVQLTGISEEVPSASSSTTKEEKRSSTAVKLAEELSQMQKGRTRLVMSETEEKVEKVLVPQEKTKEPQEKSAPRPAEPKPAAERPSKAVPVIRPSRAVTSTPAAASPRPPSAQSRPTTVADESSKVTRLRSMFVSSSPATNDSPRQPTSGGPPASASFSATPQRPRGPPARSATAAETKPLARFFSAASPTSPEPRPGSGASRGPSTAGTGKPGPPGGAGATGSTVIKASVTPAAKPVSGRAEFGAGQSKVNSTIRQLSFPDSPTSGDGGGGSVTAKRFVFGERSEKTAPKEATSGGGAKAVVGKAPPGATDKGVMSSKASVPLREKKPVIDNVRASGGRTDDTAAGGRPVSKVMDLVRNFQRLQDPNSS